MTNIVKLTRRAETFVSDAQVGVLTTLRPDGTPHSVPVCFTFDPGAGLVRVLTRAASRKARNVIESPGGRATICQVAGPKFLSMEGTAEVSGERARVEEGARWYAKRYAYAPPSPPDRVVIEIAVDRVLDGIS
ncbi:Pyridoxamine 5'-phosphate oxidase [Actinomadura rubteroloni]|uniref:Pyridoxamine 5'-phosphate oxidase n=1 Tax=Actinomadura rubteroloni TaxID=1926885 RepID=A0A2P4UFH1_9ACTN|nr:pyridoxamine 5'-phosphate oxidase family protein [Actinomadura rubteroloni]POM23772.1 Pyridoxamine 5'-phosphate oxidase [Actinomadura rubteroloni]